MIHTLPAKNLCDMHLRIEHAMAHRFGWGVRHDEVAIEMVARFGTQHTSHVDTDNALKPDKPVRCMDCNYTELRDWAWVGKALYGTCYNHPKHADGTKIKVAVIVSGEVKEGNLIKTLNTWYLICAPIK